MTKEQYADLLKNSAWQRKRKEILKRDKHTCQHCNSREKIMHVHHRYYLSGRNPWGYPNEALITLCPDCHSIEHKIKPITEFTKKKAMQEVKAEKQPAQQKQQQKPKNRQKKKHHNSKKFTPTKIMEKNQEYKSKRQKRLEAFNNKAEERRNEARKHSTIYWQPEYQHLLKKAS